MASMSRGRLICWFVWLRKLLLWARKPTHCYFLFINWLSPLLFNCRALHRQTHTYRSRAFVCVATVAPPHTAQPSCQRLISTPTKWLQILSLSFPKLVPVLKTCVHMQVEWWSWKVLYVSNLRIFAAPVCAHTHTHAHTV